MELSSYFYYFFFLLTQLNIARLRINATALGEIRYKVFLIFFSNDFQRREYYNNISRRRRRCNNVL